MLQEEKMEEKCKKDKEEIQKRFADVERQDLLQDTVTRSKTKPNMS